MSLGGRTDEGRIDIGIDKISKFNKEFKDSFPSTRLKSIQPANCIYPAPV
jgi:hypothetical protein